MLEQNQPELLERGDSLFSIAFNHAAVGMALVSPEGRWLKVNSALCGLLGYSEEELLSRGFQGMTHADDLEYNLAKMQELLDGQIASYDIEKRYLDPQGNSVPVALSVSLVRSDGGAPRFFIAQIQNSGECMQVEESLIQEKILLDSLMDTIPDLIYFKNRQSQVLRVNTTMARRLGYNDPTQAIGLTDFDFYDEAHARQAYDDEQRIMTTGEIILNEEEKEVWSDGRETWVSTTKVPRRDEQGAIMGIIGISRDITERKLTAEKLRYNEQRFRTLVEATTSIVWNTTASGKFESPQPAWTAFTGQNFEEFQGLGWQEAVHPEDRKITAGSWSEALVGRSTYQVQHRLRRHDGVYRHMSVRAVPLLAENGTIIEWVGVHTDITDQILAEAEKDRLNNQLVDVSRRAGMSEVATSVLHNVGNVLNSVNISCSVISEKVRQSRIGTVAKTAAVLKEHSNDMVEFLNSNPQGRQLPDFLAKLAERLAAEQSGILAELDLLDRNIEHISQIIAVQQSYANVGGVQETLSVAELVDDALRMNSVAMTRHHITVIRDFGELPPVMMEKHKVLQILVNLIRNAKHALTDGGSEDKRLTLRIAMQGAECFVISVNDNGIGIAPENMARIFAHGFTTKKEGHGFGLHSGALAAQEMGGSLTVHSDGLGHGATFALELPIAPPAASSKSKS
jgi:PAS domain S-box-containing protein